MAGSAEAFLETARRALEPEVVADLAVISEVVGRSGARVLLVGGMVRDVLLERPSRDVDLVVLGPAGTLAADLAAALSARVEAQSELGTWRLGLPGGRRLDLATARRETYPSPASLPAVSPGDLATDLARRDFTVNAMAVEIGTSWDEIVDPHAGRADLAAGLLRVLHPGSFRDDPTRVLRGIELAVRLAFELEPYTADLAKEALAAGVLEALSPARWENAWRRAFLPLLAAGAGPLTRGLRLAAGLGLPAALHPGLRLDERATARAGRLAERAHETRFRDAGPAELLARALAWQEPGVAAALARRWGLGPKTEGEWTSFPRRLGAAVGALGGDVGFPASRLDAALAGFSAAELCLLELSPALEVPLERYLEEVAPFRLKIGGADLKARGYAPGPRFRAALAKTRRARLDGVIGEDEELEYACSRLEATDG